MKLLRDRILVRRLVTETATVSGIIIPDTAQKKSTHGEVVCVGPGPVTKTGVIMPIDLKPGDVVAFEEHAGWPFTIDGVEHQIIREEQVLCVLKQA